MVNPFLVHPRDRLKAWRHLRESCCQGMDDVGYLSKVAEFWGHAPISSPYLDYTDPGTWPDAWILIDSNDFDLNAIGLGMFYTLVLASDQRWVHRTQLMYIRNYNQSTERLVVVVDDVLVLNYQHGSPSRWPLEDPIMIMHRYIYHPATRSISEQDNTLT